MALSAAVLQVLLSCLGFPAPQVSGSAGRASPASHLSFVFPLVWEIYCKRDGDRCLNVPEVEVLPGPGPVVESRLGGAVWLPVQPFPLLGLQLDPVYQTPGTWVVWFVVRAHLC